MRKILLFLVFSLLILINIVCYALAEETITLTTYCPAPYGVYGHMATNYLGVGDNNNSGGMDSGFN